MGYYSHLGVAGMLKGCGVGGGNVSTDYSMEGKRRGSRPGRKKERLRGSAVLNMVRRSRAELIHGPAAIYREGTVDNGVLKTAHSSP